MLIMAMSPPPFKKQYKWGTSTEITAATTLFQMKVYHVATDSYRPGVPGLYRSSINQSQHLLANATNCPGNMFN